MVDYSRWDKLAAETNEDFEEESPPSTLWEGKDSRTCRLYSICNDSYSGKS